MAASNNRDVKMTLSVETLGAEDIKKLQDSVAKLATEGGQAAPEFQKLADEIGRLGEQASALQAFRQLANETEALAEKQTQASASAGELGVKLQAAERVTASAAAEQKNLAASLSELQLKAKETRDSLDLLTAQTAEAKKADESYAVAVSDLKVKKIEQRAEIEKLKSALADATAEVKQAEAAENKLAASYEYAASQAKAAEAALQVNKNSVKAAADAANALNVATDNVAAAQTALVQGFNSAGQAAQDMQAHIDKLANKQRELTEIRAFEKQAEEARRLVIAGEYAELFDQALSKLTETKKQQKAQDSAKQWQSEAFALVEAAEAAQKLKRETEALEDAKRTLAANDAFEKQYTEARKLEQASSYVRELGDALNRLEAEQEQMATSAKASIDQYQAKLRAAKVEADTTATAAKDAADKISNAFKTVGVRSAEELRAEIAQVREAMNTVKASAAATGSAVDGAFRAGQARIKELERDIREVSGTLTMTDKAAGLLKNSMGQITAGNIVADGVGYLVNKVKELGVAFLGAIVDGDQMRRGLNAIYKDANVTASQIDFLRRSSSESGVAFGQLSKEFVKFSASMQLSNVPLEQSNNLFKAVTAATASLGLGTEATAGALNALGQMASKGTVSLEELRQQLGDRLPGAIGLTAQGLGITEAQLIKLVESGGLATRDFIVPFTQALGKLKGENDGLVPAFDRLKGTLSEVAQGMGDAGGTTVLTGALKVLGGFVASVGLGLSVIVEGLFLFGSTLTAIAARVNGDATAFDFLAQQLEKSTNRLTGQATALNNFLEPSEAAAASTTKHAAAMTANTVEIVKSIDANASLTVAQKLTALSTALIGNATSGAASNIVQYNVASDAMLKQQNSQTEAYVKLAKAAKEQGDTLIKQAELTGDATIAQKASVAAAELNVVALEKVAVSQQAELDILVARKEVLLADSKARGITADQIKVQADELDKLIIKNQAESEQAKQASLASKAALFERQLTIEKLKDHSAEVSKFKAEMESVAKTLVEYERLALNGKKTEEQVTEARQAVTRATALYRDALSDTITKIELEAKAKGANLQLSIVQSNTAQKHAELMASQSRAIGDVTMATIYDIEAKEASIKTIKLQTQLAALEAEAALKTNEIKRLEIPLNDVLRTQKLAVLDVEAALIKVKLAGSDAAKETIKSIENEITALRNGTTAYGGNTSAIGSNTGARNNNSSATDRQIDAMDRLMMKYTLSANYTERQIALLEREAETIEKVAAAERKRLNVDKDKFSLDGNGQRISAMETDAQLGQRVGNKYGADYAKDPNAIKAANLSMQLEAVRKGAYNLGGSNSPEITALIAELAKAENELNKTKVEAAATSAPAFNRPAVQAPAPNPASSGQTVLVKIDLGNGRSYDVNTASANDANQLQDFMSALQSAKRGAGM